MAKEPAFQLYSQDFLIGVLDLDDADVGKYIKLLCFMHQKGRLTEKQIEKLVGKLSTELLSKFELDEKGRYYNLVLEEVMTKRQKFKKKQKENIEKRWNKEYQNDTKQIPNEYQSDTKHDTKTIPLEYEIEYEYEDEIEFEQFWIQYPVKIRKNEVQEMWEGKKLLKTGTRITPSIQRQIIEKLPDYMKYKARSGESYMHPKTLLNSEFWEDEYNNSKVNEKHKIDGEEVKVVAPKLKRQLTEQDIKELNEIRQKYKNMQANG